MNANQNKIHTKQDPKINFDLISLEKAQPLSLWQKMKMAFTSSDMDFQSWQRLESKRVMKRSSSEHWRNH